MQVPRFHLPMQGRDDVLDSLLDSVDKPGLTTLWGPGGMGKTRMAVELFDRCRRRRQRVLFGSVFEGARPDGLFRQMLRAGGVPRAFRMGASPAERLGRWLSQDTSADGASPLIVVDEAELALASVCTVVQELVEHTDAHIVVTSREALELDGETTVQLDPLGVEDAARVLVAAAPRGTAADLEGARRISERLEGLPLALTLAAGRLEVVSLEELERRLEDPLPMLRNPSTDGRHSALRVSIDASVQGIPDWARKQLQALPVFASHFSLEAAEAVLSVVPTDALVMDGLQLLARRSLLRVLDGEAGPRFQLAPFVREAVAAWGPLDDAVLTRWLSWIGERALSELYDRHLGVSDGAWLDREEADLDKALTIARAQPDVDPLILSRLGAACVSLPMEFEERRELADLLLTLDADRVDPRARVKIEEAQASVGARMGDLDRSITHLNRAIEASRAVGDRVTEANLMGILGNRYDNLGEGDRALELYRHSLSLAEDEGNLDQLTRGMIAVSITEDWEMSWNPERSLERFESLIPSQFGLCRMDLQRRSAQLHWSLNQAEPALAHLEQCEPEQPSPELWQSVECLLLRAYIEIAQDRSEAAEGSLDLAEQRSTFAGFMKQRGTIAVARAQLDLRRGRYDRVVRELAPWVGTLMEGRPDWLETALVAEGLRAIASARAGDDRQAGESLASAGRLAALESISLIYPPLAELLPHLVNGALRLAALEAGETLTEDASREERRAAIDAFEPRYAPDLLEMQRYAAIQEAAIASLESAWVSYGTSGFESPDGTLVDLRRSRSSSRIFAALASRRLDEPGGVLTAEALIEAGWPGESLVPSAARNRLHVALASLRKKGLDALLEHVDGGYRLDPQVAFREGQLDAG